MDQKVLNKKVWVVSMVDSGGFPHVTITEDRDQAIAAFMQHTYFFVHACTNSTVFRVVGEDYDGGFTGLHLLMDLKDDSMCVLSLTSPGRISPQPGCETFPLEK